jgi:hypothetical protein
MLFNDHLFPRRSSNLHGILSIFRSMQLDSDDVELETLSRYQPIMWGIVRLLAAWSLGLCTRKFLQDITGWCRLHSHHLAF